MIIDIIKFLFSDDFRTSVKELNRLRKSSKSWKDDMKINEGKFDETNKEEASLLLSDSVHFLRERNWLESDIINARLVFWELFENALEYGTKEDEKIIVKTTSSRTFWKLEVSDRGKGFNLKEVLKKQGAFEYSNDKETRGLALVCRISPQLKNHKTRKLHTVSTLITKGQGKIKISKIEEITAFELIGNAFESPYYFDKFTDKLNSLTENSKILLSFIPLSKAKKKTPNTSRVAPTRVIRDFEKAALSTEIPHKIAILGLETFSYEIAEYFNKRFKCFEFLDKAIEYLNE